MFRENQRRTVGAAISKRLMKHIHTDKHINHLYYTISSAGCSGAKLLHAKKMNDRSSIH